MKEPASEFRVSRGPLGRGGLTRQPLRVAFWLTLGYFALSLTYILVSGSLAGYYADNLADLERIEQIKGVAFVVVTSLLLFALTFFLFHKLALHQRAAIDYRDSLLTANRRASAGLFASSVAHDINNILTVIENVTGLLEDASGDEKELLLSHLTAANHDLKSLVARLKTIRGGADAEADEEFDIAAAFRRIVDLVRSHRKARECDFRLDVPPELPFCGRRVLVHQMLLNLLINAAEASGGRGTVEGRLIDGPQEILVEVHDDGPGVSEEDRERIMEPLITTKSDGCGLGLLSVQACAEAHRGRVEIERSPFGGACFRVRLQQGRAGVRNGASSAPAQADRPASEALPKGVRR